MRITTQGDYAMRCLLNIAKNGGQGPVAIRRIVQEEGLPPDYAEQLLLKLRRAGLIKSVRGSKGGYSLGRPGRKITIKDVLEAVEGGAFEVICSRKRKGAATSCRHKDCVLKKVWIGLKGKIEDYLESVTLERLLGRRGD